MKKKYYLIIRAWSFAALAIVFITTPFYANLEMPDLFAIIAFVVCAGLSFWYFKQLRSLSKDGKQPFYPSPATDATPREKTTYFRWMMYMSIVVFPLQILITIQDLNDIESGRVQEISTWEPLALLYERWGYWAPIIFLVLMGALAITGFLWLIKRIGRTSPQKSA